MHSFLSSRSSRLGLVTLRQTFVRRCHLGWTASEPPHFSRNGTVAPPPQRRKQRRTNETPPTSGNSQMGEEPFLNWNAPPIVLNGDAQLGQPAAADRGAAHAGQSWTCGWCSTAPPSATGSARAASRAASGRDRGREDRGADQGRAAADQQPADRQGGRSCGKNSSRKRRTQARKFSRSSLRVRLSAWTLLADANSRKPCARRGAYVGRRTATGPGGIPAVHGMIGAARGRPAGRRIAPPRCYLAPLLLGGRGGVNGEARQKGSTN